MYTPPSVKIKDLKNLDIRKFKHQSGCSKKGYKPLFVKY